jgi:predicted alpha-1,2-mannosidase
MIPSVAPPFAMTRWTPQTRENFISQVAYSDHDRRMHGFQATHQPAIWMGEQGQVVLMPGVGETVRPQFERRGLAFRKRDETSTPYVYEVLLDADSVGEFGWDLTEQWASETMGDQCPPCPGGAGSVPDSVSEGAGGDSRVRRDMAVLGEHVMDRDGGGACPVAYKHAIRVAMSASAHVGHLRADFEDYVDNGSSSPYFTIQASRLNWTGHVEVDAGRREVSGSNSQRQDWALGPDKPQGFRGYFVSRFSEPFSKYGVTQAGDVAEDSVRLEGKDVGAYVTFGKSVKRVEVRTGVSFISVEQARRNLDLEIPDTASFEDTVENVKTAWREKLDRVTVTGANVTDEEHDPRTVFYTGLFHGLQYPNDYSEPTTSINGGKRRFYSGYTDSVHEEQDSYYQSWSIWDTYRAEHSLLTIFAPERVDSMMRSLLKIFDWSGRLPLWANMVETNIMIATNADAVLANALSRGFKDFDIAKAWIAVKKDAYEPPVRDTELLYYDREPNTPHEARAGLTSYLDHGWVDNDRWAESASRTLDYAFNDWACAVLAKHAGEDDAAVAELLRRSYNYKNTWHNETQFMRARNSNGSWADESWGWTEGDKWVYTFDVMHDVGGLAALFEHGAEGMKRKLDEHFADGHNLHSNEPSHHVPYLFSMLGYPDRAAEEIKHLAESEYNATAAGLSGNEDLGQMSAWYVFSALGFYPVNPAGDEYVVGTPFFDEVKITLPDGPGVGGEHELLITATGAGTKGFKYVKGLKIDGKKVHRPVVKHGDVVGARKIEFEMSNVKTRWGEKGTI